MKSFGSRYAARYTRTAVLPAASKGLQLLIKRVFTGAVLLVLFAICVNLIVKYAVSHMPKFKLNIVVPQFKFFADDKYVIEEGGRTYVVSSNGVIKPDIADRDGRYLVRLIGVWTDEKRPEYRAAFKQAVAIDKKHLSEISDINVRNLKNIMVITADGAVASLGDSITNEKMENLSLALETMKEKGKRCKAMNLAYEDMVIIK